jgi:hypothetical protein
VLTSTPPASPMARRRMAACSSRTAGQRSPSSWSSRVEPSMSVNRNVTVPAGRSPMDVMACQRYGAARPGASPPGGSHF